MIDPDATAIRVTIGRKVLRGWLGTSAPARDLIAQLPLTVRFRDLNGVEKYADLPRTLSVDGVPDGDHPDPADIGYYAPGGNLVFYYGDITHGRGIVRIGAFNGSVDALAAITHDFFATVERA